MWCVIQSTLLVVAPITQITQILRKVLLRFNPNMECLHRSKPARKRCELLSPKQSRINLTEISNSEVGKRRACHNLHLSISHILSGEATKANPALQVSVLQTPFSTTFSSFLSTIQVPNTTIWHKNEVILYHLSKSTGFENYLNSSFSSFILVPAV